MSVNTYPTSGFSADIDTSSLLINGSQITANVTEAISEAQLERVLVGASTLTLTIEDPARTLVNSPIAQIVAPTAPGQGLAPFAPYEPTTCAIQDPADGSLLVFALCSIEKQSDELTLTFEDIWINALRYCYAQGEGYYTATGTMTRADFMQAVIRKALPLMAIPVQPVPDNFSSSAFGGVQQIETDTGDSQWGTTDAPNEDAWTCLTRLANTAQWRCFSTGKAIVIGPDAWLLSLPVAATFVENTEGVDSIDFTYDMNQAQASATVHANTALTSFPPGTPVALKQLGIANGTWLCSDISRSLFLPDATIGLVQAQPSLTEAQIAAANANGTGTSDSQTASTTAAVIAGDGTAQAQQAVKYALAQVGKPYIWGGTGPGGYDCSGLCFAAYGSAGVSIPRTSEAQWAGLPHVDMSQLQPGDLIFYAGSDGTTTDPGHVVMYIGNGQVVEAIQTGTNIQTGPVPGGYIGAARPTGSSSTGTLA